ncbi:MULTISPECIES: hypothetical protein [Delftia]|uniref:hypothetical protein n=1 Tax=Delftia TaxID=80865 RepID=UPI000F84DB54|nr:MULTISPECIES: hypothetical protein [Delftia]MDH0850866.1 hypothetical protein [Delftia tsuruhatensis]WAT83021.1 hypothetical protein O1V13_16210 [Delftia acidovorans]WEL95691.1 hypothetical protein PW274_16590 [Delftia tsuruhatensis]WQM80189.1 hypothetical protein RNT40_15830 [Delftia tsuruhatensis]
MQFKHIISAAAIALIAGTSHAWNLVYSHDGNGNATLGSLQALRTAVINGASVKIVTHESGVHFWSAPCAQVSVRDDATQAVVCLGHVDFLVNLNQGPQFGVPLQPPHAANFAANTIGQYNQTDIQSGNGAILSQKVFRGAINWYVN